MESQSPSHRRMITRTGTSMDMRTLMSMVPDVVMTRVILVEVISAQIIALFSTACSHNFSQSCISMNRVISLLSLLMHSQPLEARELCGSLFVSKR